MIDKNKIPSPLLNEMMILFGEKKTEQIAKGVGYSYHGLVWKVNDEKFKRRFGIRIFPFTAIVIVVIILIIILL